MREIENADHLTSIFGGWPSFHDSNLLSVALKTAGPESPILVATFHVFETISKTDSSGYFVQQNHTKVELSFSELRRLELGDFMEGNIVLSFDIDTIDPDANEGRCFEVAISPSYGCYARFQCRGIRVLSAAPLEGNPRAAQHLSGPPLSTGKDVP